MATIASRVTALETKVKNLETASVAQGNRITALETLLVAVDDRLKVVEAELAEPAPEPDPVPVPDPEPDPEEPPLEGWPNATNTGAKGTLTNRTGFATSSHGQMIENLNVTGQIYVGHNNVVIRNCKVTESGDTCIFVVGDDVLIEDCTLFGGTTAASRGVWIEGNTQDSANRATIRRCDISGYEDGVCLGTGQYHKVMDNYFHDPVDYRVPNDPHIDGIQLHGGSANFSIIEHNNIDGYPEVSSSMTCGNRTPGQGAIGLTIKNNRMNGGTSVLYIEGSDSRDNVVSGNHMGNSVYGYYTSGTGIGGATYSGNVDINTGAPIL